MALPPFPGLSSSTCRTLVLATVKNDEASVRRLLKAGADANFALPVAPPATGEPTKILPIAMANKSYAAALALLDAGADANVTDKGGNTPLHVAAQTGSLELVKKLLAKGAKTDVRTAPAPTGGRGGAGGGGFR